MASFIPPKSSTGTAAPWAAAPAATISAPGAAPLATSLATPLAAPVAAPLVLPLRFSTHALPPADQFAAWRDFTAPAVNLDLVQAPDTSFAAAQEVWDLGSMALTVATMPGAGYVRSWQHWRRPALDHWCLVLCPPGPNGAAAFGLRSLATPFQGGGSDERVISLFIPRDLFPHLAPQLDGAPTDLPLEGLGGILADHLSSLTRQLPLTAACDVPGLATATQALLAATLAPRSDLAAGATDLVAQTLRERARRIIRQNIASPTLSPDMLCRALGVSRSRLYRLFEELGGVSRYIQRQRLRAAFTLLNDPNERRAVSQIAEELGFCDHSGFSRAFKAEFGLSPSAARAASGVPQPIRLPHAPPANLPASTPLRDLGDILGRLQP
ncbi:helix-turn-helix domain-containing protein [Xanthobacter variabilis]|uniref:helix-turn-helix domain-containing protein n=1 Tax=Xanthobacter variabilis TaxID=3119932 RepID=UPI00374E35C5